MYANLDNKLAVLLVFNYFEFIFYSKMVNAGLPFWFMMIDVHELRMWWITMMIYYWKIVSTYYGLQRVR